MRLTKESANRLASQAIIGKLSHVEPWSERHEQNLATAVKLFQQGKVPYRNLRADGSSGTSFANIARARAALPWSSLMRVNYWRMRYLEHRVKSLDVNSLQSFSAAQYAERAVVSGYEALKQGDSDLANTYFRIGSVLVDLAVSLTPIIGTSRDLFEAIGGVDLITGEELSRTDRGFAMMSVLTLGTLGSVTAGRKAIYFMMRERHGFKGAQAVLDASDDAAMAWRRSLNIKNVGGASNSHPPDYAALRTRLAAEEKIGKIWSKLYDTRLANLIPGSKLMIPGTRIGDPRIRSLLAQDGANIADWGYYEYALPGKDGSVVLHYYWNNISKRIWSEVKIKVHLGR